MSDDHNAKTPVNPANQQCDRKSRIEQQLQEVFQPTQLLVRDDSKAHAKHSGHGGKGHFTVQIVSHCFEGKRLLERHRLIHQALEALLETDIHALQIVAQTPEEATRKEIHP